MAQSTVITLRIGTDLQEQIKAMAQKEEIPASYIIRRLIKAGLSAEGKHLQSNIKKTDLSVEDWQ